MYSRKKGLNKYNEFNKDDTSDTANPFYQLLEKQATEFELFGQRLKSDIQNSYREFLRFQQQHQDSQSELVDSLRARIEDLENHSGSEIRRLKQELHEFKIKYSLLFEQNKFEKTRPRPRNEPVNINSMNNERRIKDIIVKLNNAENGSNNEEDEDVESIKGSVITEDFEEEFEELEEDSQNIIIRMRVPKHLHRIVIGRKGSTVNQIQTDTRTKIRIGNPVIIRGARDGVEMAKRRIENIIETEKLEKDNEGSEDKDNFTHKFIIPTHLIGPVVGRGGKTLNQIRTETRTNIKIQSRGFSTIVGPKEGVEIARRRIETIMEQISNKINNNDDRRSVTSTISNPRTEDELSEIESTKDNKEEFDENTTKLSMVPSLSMVPTILVPIPDELD